MADLVLVTKTCSGDRISFILKNFIPKFSALNSKHFTYMFLNKESQTTQLHNIKPLVQTFSQGLKTGLISTHIGEPYTDADNL